MKLSQAAKAAATPAATPTTKPMLCGFCRDGSHQHCPRAVANGERPRKIWPCACSDPKCGGGSVLRCLTCKNERPGDVSPQRWECIDPEACRVRVTKRLAANPAFQQIKEIAMPNAAKKAAAPKAATAPKKAPRDCACECGGETKGGVFLAGHDARFVKELVAEARAGGFKVATKRAVMKKMKESGASPVLAAKLEKQLVVAESKPAPTTRAASNKPAAKKAAAKKATPGKASVAPVTVPDDDEDDEDF